MAFRIPNLPTRIELKNMQLQYVNLLAERLEKKMRRANEFVVCYSVLIRAGISVFGTLKIFLWVGFHGGRFEFGNSLFF